jgi:HlyD family secretion protein
MMADTPRRRTWSSRYPLTISLLGLLLMATLIGAWSLRARISGAVIGSGTVEVSQTMTAVQHPVGGVVEEIIATNGDRVEAGDVVVRLEDVQLRSDLAVVEGSLYEILANIARLEAVIDGREQMELHPLLAEAAATHPEIDILVQRQKRQLFAHFEALATEARLLDEQVAQVNAQIVGLEAEINSRNEEMTHIASEMSRLEELAGRGLVKQVDLFNLQKARTFVRGEIGKLAAKIAELRGKISEIELKRHTIVPKERKLAVAELSKLRPERTKFLERRASLLDSLGRLEIRAPISGRIHDTQVQGLRSVVVAAKPLMMIVPDEDPTFISVKIRDTDIDQVHVGQTASLKFKAFDGRHIPLILGRVDGISANVLIDPHTRRSYYEITLVLDETELAKLGGRHLLPGMPVEAFLSTESRTPLNYVLRPLMTYFDRAFRDA